MSAANQQERLLTFNEQKRWFLAGLIEGDGSLCVSIKKHKPSRFGYLISPGLFIYQHKERRDLLDSAIEVFATGRITPKPGNEDVLVYSLTARRELKERVLPFYEHYMIFSSSSKKRDYRFFKEIVLALDNKEHYTPQGMVEIVKKVYKMNFAGKQRKRPCEEVIRRILRD